MTNPPNYSELMNELWEASEGGTAEWWLKGKHPHNKMFFKAIGGWCLRDPISQNRLLISDQIAYFIAKGHAEEWLESSGFISTGWPSKYSHPMSSAMDFGVLLPAALAYAQQKQSTKETHA